MGDYHQMRSEESEAIDGVNPAGELLCTRYYSHQGDHVAAHTNGSILARWGTSDDNSN